MRSVCEIAAHQRKKSIIRLFAFGIGEGLKLYATVMSSKRIVSDRSTHLDALCPFGRFLPHLAARDIRAAFFRDRQEKPIDGPDSRSFERRGVRTHRQGLALHLCSRDQAPRNISMLARLAPRLSAKLLRQVNGLGTVDARFPFATW